MPHLLNAREALVIVRVLRCAGGMGRGLSRATKREITKKHARRQLAAAGARRARNEL